MAKSTPRPRRLCECGCGEIVKPGNKFIRNHHSRMPETRRKISKSNKGRIFSKEHRENISIAKTGHKMSDETKRKMSNSKMGGNNPMYGLTGEKSPLFGRRHTAKSIANPMYRPNGLNYRGISPRYSKENLLNSPSPIGTTKL